MQKRGASARPASVLLDALLHLDSLDGQDKAIDLLTELNHLGIDKAAALFYQHV
ncbi:hypothetical protein D3C73_1622840 [compost metagenome]